MTTSPVNGLEIIDPAKIEHFGLTARTDIQVSTSDIVGIVTTRYMKEIKKQVRASEEEIEKAKVVLRDARVALEVRCNEDAEKYGEKQCENFQKAFASIGLGFCKSCMVAIGEDGYAITHKVWSHESKEYNYNHSSSEKNVIVWKEEVTFRKAGAIKLKNDIIKAEEQLAGLERRQLDWRRKLSEIPDVADRARAALAERALNQTEGGQMLMQSISDAFNDEFKDVETFTPVALLEG